MSLDPEQVDQLLRDGARPPPPACPPRWLLAAARTALAAAAALSRLRQDPR